MGELPLGTRTRLETLNVAFVAAIGLMLLSSQGWSMGMERFGNEPFSDVANYVSWPNVMPVINDTHRVYHTG